MTRYEMTGPPGTAPEPPPTSPPEVPPVVEPPPEVPPDIEPAAGHPAADTGWLDISSSFGAVLDRRRGDAG